MCLQLTNLHTHSNHTHIYTHSYICIYRERDWERDRERKRETALNMYNEVSAKSWFFSISGFWRNQGFGKCTTLHTPETELRFSCSFLRNWWFFSKEWDLRTWCTLNEISMVQRDISPKEIQKSFDQWKNRLSSILKKNSFFVNIV